MRDGIRCFAKVQYCHVCLGSGDEGKRSSMVVRSCVSQEKPAMKPWLRYVGMLCSSR